MVFVAGGRIEIRADGVVIEAGTARATGHVRGAFARARGVLGV